jgi:hypothetical protein
MIRPLAHFTPARRLPRRGRFHRTLLVLASAGPTIADGARGLWRSDEGRRWLAPLLIFLCVTGLLLGLIASVEALAPFIYSIF